MNTNKLNSPRGCLSRLVRISLPALLWGGLFAIFEPTMGGMCAIVGFWLGLQRADAAEAKLAMIREKAESALQTSWLYSGKEHVEKLMREIAEISSENV